MTESRAHEHERLATEALEAAADPEVPTAERTLWKQTAHAHKDCAAAYRQLTKAGVRLDLDPMPAPTAMPEPEPDLSTPDRFRQAMNDYYHHEQRITRGRIADHKDLAAIARDAAADPETGQTEAAAWRRIATAHTKAITAYHRLQTAQEAQRYTT